MTREHIIEQVQVRLDELSPFDDIEEVPSINYIDKIIDDSTTSVFRLLPAIKLPATDMSRSNILKGSMKGEYYVNMDESYIKLASGKLSSWTRPVTHVANENEKILQGSEITMGKPHSPIIEERKLARTVSLHFFSDVDGGSSPEFSLLVITAKKPEECPDNLVDAIAWQCAADVLGSLGKYDDAEKAQRKVLQHGI